MLGYSAISTETFIFFISGATFKITTPDSCIMPCLPARITMAALHIHSFSRMIIYPIMTTTSFAAFLRLNAMTWTTEKLTLLHFS